jgi:hypothetical protein
MDDTLKSISLLLWAVDVKLAEKYLGPPTVLKYVRAAVVLKRMFLFFSIFAKTLAKPLRKIFAKISSCFLRKKLPKCF